MSQNITDVMLEGNVAVRKRESTSQLVVSKVGAAIAARRQVVGLSQLQVAHAIGVERETVARMEGGSIAPSLPRLAQLAEVLSYPIGAFFDGYSDLAESDALRMSGLIADLPKANRDAIVQIVSYVAQAMRMTVLPAQPGTH